VLVVENYLEGAKERAKELVEVDFHHRHDGF
jgi:hypothetical protein